MQLFFLTPSAKILFFFHCKSQSSANDFLQKKTFIVFTYEVAAGFVIMVVAKNLVPNDLVNEKP